MRQFNQAWFAQLTCAIALATAGCTPEETHHAKTDRGAATGAADNDMPAVDADTAAEPRDAGTGSPLVVDADAAQHVDTAGAVSMAGTPAMTVDVRCGPANSSYWFEQGSCRCLYGYRWQNTDAGDFRCVPIESQGCGASEQQ